MKYTVLTYIIGNYQKVHEIENKQNDVEYLLVTDNPLLKSNTWTIIYDESLLKMESNWNRTFYVRYNLFNYCKTDICVRIDGSIGIKGSLDSIVNKLIDENYDLGLLIHECRNNIMDELKAWKYLRNYPDNKILNQMMFFDKSHYPMDYKGLIELTMSVTRNTKIQKEIDQLTYYFVSYLSRDLQNFQRLDQTIFSYVLNTYYSHLKVLPLSNQVIKSDVLQKYNHNSNIVNINGKNIHQQDVLYLFNKPVACYYIHNNELKTKF